jgi:hypothetical protein
VNIDKIIKIRYSAALNSARINKKSKGFIPFDNQVTDEKKEIRNAKY